MIRRRHGHGARGRELSRDPPQPHMIGVSHRLTLRTAFETGLAIRYRGNADADGGQCVAAASDVVRGFLCCALLHTGWYQVLRR